MLHYFFSSHRFYRDGDLNAHDYQLHDYQCVSDPN